MARRGLYQPFIEDRNVRRLHLLKGVESRRAGRTVPMTILLNRILDAYFESEDDPDAASAPRRPVEDAPRGLP